MLEGVQGLTRGHRVHVNAIFQIGDDKGVSIATDDRITATEVVSSCRKGGKIVKWHTHAGQKLLTPPHHPGQNLISYSDVIY